MKKKKKAAAVFLIITAVLFIAAASYFGYVLLFYYRIEDNLPADIGGGAQTGAARKETGYSAVTWNVGFGAYSAEYTFFMDGGKYSRAYSERAVYDNINGAVGLLRDIGADIMLVQEIDKHATRSWHVDEKAIFESVFDSYDTAFAVNYDSPYLLYPPLSPHGKSLSGLETFSKIKINSALRHSLPVEESLYRLLDLDRCYTKARIAVEGGGELVVYNVHLSAYTSDGTIATRQLEILANDMRAEYKAGNWAICGGDFNKDIYGNSPVIFGVSGKAFTWAQPIHPGIIEDGISIADSLDPENPVPSCRNPDRAYIKGESFVLTVDAFIVSDNIEITDAYVVDAGFEFSDHNPVYITFILR